MTKLNGKTLIVIPALNEEASVAGVIKDVRRHVPLADCLIVNDGSQDNTSRVAREAGGLVADLPYNLGVGGAMRVGFAYALSEGYSHVVQVDADGQHDPRDVPRLVNALADADLVLGARFAGKGDYKVTGPRWWSMRFLAKVLSKSAGTRLTDTTSGFRASGPRAIKLFAEHYPAEYLGDTVESLVIAARAGLTITQIPVEMRQRVGGEPSHKPFKSAVFLARVGIAMTFALIRPGVKVGDVG